MADTYLVLKSLHVISAVLMVGNVTVTGVWATFYFRWRKDADFRLAARAILWTDLIFTFLGGATVFFGPFRVRALVRVRWPRTGRPRRCRMPR